MRGLRALAALGGLAVAAWLVWEVGPVALAGEMRRLSWRLPLLVLPQALVSLLDAAGWRWAFPGRRPPLGTLIAVRLAGEAVNDTTPTATLGGEAVKAWLLTRARVPLDQGLASVVVAKTAFVAAQVGFLALGLGLVAWRFQPAPALLTLMAGLLGGGIVAVGGFIWAQQHGLLERSGRVLGWLGIGGVSRLERLDREVREFYRRRPHAFALSVFLHLLGWMAGSVEVWLALRFLGQPVDPPTAIAIEALATGIRSASFLIPAAMGVQEGGLVAIFVGFGLSAGAGLALGLVRRLREAVWAALGYAVLALWRGVRGPAPEPLRP